MAKKTILRDTREDLEKELQKALEKAADLLEERIRINITLTDHSQDDLNAIGNPYSVKNPKRIHRPGFKVHRQSGDLVSALGQVKQKGKILVGIDESLAPHAPGIILGTSKMVARDFITGSFNQVREDINKIISKAVRKATKQ